MCPNFGSSVFVKDAGAGEVESLKVDEWHKADVEAKPASALLEMEKAKAQLVPTLTVEELDKPMQQLVTYQRMTILAKPWQN